MISFSGDHVIANRLYNCLGDFMRARLQSFPSLLLLSAIICGSSIQLGEVLAAAPKDSKTPKEQCQDELAKFHELIIRPKSDKKFGNMGTYLREMKSYRDTYCGFNTNAGMSNTRKNKQASISKDTGSEGHFSAAARANEEAMRVARKGLCETLWKFKQYNPKQKLKALWSNCKKTAQMPSGIEPAVLRELGDELERYEKNEQGAKKKLSPFLYNVREFCPTDRKVPELACVR
jgi:hypothetical protein